MLKIRNRGMVNAVYGIVEVEHCGILVKRRTRELGNIRIYDITSIIRSAYIVPGFRPTLNISYINYFAD